MAQSLPERARTDDQRNLFIRYINQGRIGSLEELKRTYRRIVMKTHPDAVGSDSLVEEYIECRRCYEEAKAIFNKEEKHLDPGADEGVRDYRLLFYQDFYRLERIDKPYAFNKYYFSKATDREMQTAGVSIISASGSRIGLAFIRRPTGCTTRSSWKSRGAPTGNTPCCSI